VSDRAPLCVKSYDRPLSNVPSTVGVPLRFRFYVLVAPCQSFCMRKRAGLLTGGASICASLAIIAFVVSKLISSSIEPTYDGHPLSHWVTRLSETTYLPNSENEKATNAINHIGVAALPFLLKWIVEKDTPRWKPKLARLLDRIPFAVTHQFSKQLAKTTDPKLGFATYGAFKVLGKRAAPALDDLCEIINDPNNTYSTTLHAVWNLRCLGTNALPALLSVATNRQKKTRLAALTEIGTMSDLGNATEPTVIAITSCMRRDRTNADYQLVAIRVLGELKAAPQIFVPALASCLQSTDAGVRARSAETLGRLGSQAGSAIPALTNVLTDPDPNVQTSAILALRKIAPLTFTDVVSRAGNSPVFSR